MARVQDNPQSQSYTTRADKKKTAKPVGARFTDKLAKRLGKKSTTKPTTAELEKYLGKGVYKEKRKDKSDVNPKAKFAKGGQASPQSENYTARADKKKTAKPVGVRFTDKLAKRLGKKSTTRPTSAEVDKYLNKGVYKENRKDKSDVNPKAKFMGGGDTEYARGGKTQQTYPQYPKTYNEFRDITKESKPVGYRYTDALAKRLGVNPLATPTNAHIKKYIDKGVYWENRADKSDISRKDKLEGGGDTEYARGGNINETKVYAIDLSKFDDDINPKQLSDDKFIEEAEKQGLVYSLDGFEKSFNNEEISDQWMIRVIKGKSDSYAKGGQAPSYKETYYGHKWKKSNDIASGKAKPVGYRYTDKLAKRLGVNKYSKPTEAHIERYLGNGIYFENRKDKSDIRPTSKLEMGGDTEMARGGKTQQTYPQYPKTYNEFRDITKESKPVGYRYTDKLAKRLGVSPLATPTNAHIKKYLDKGVYWENRADKSDISRKDKLEQGGDTEMAKGGQARISNSEASSYAENHQPFKGNNLEAKTLANGDYVVLSYGYYPIWFWHKKENKWYQNKNKFSQTTARHISASRPTHDAQVVSREELDSMMAKSLEGSDFMALGGELSSMVVTQ